MGSELLKERVYDLGVVNELQKDPLENQIILKEEVDLYMVLFGILLEEILVYYQTGIPLNVNNIIVVEIVEIEGTMNEAILDVVVKN